MNPRFERPRTVAEAAAILAFGEGSPLAGGTDLYAAHVGKPIAQPLVDLSLVAGLRGIRRSDAADNDDAGWTIGATTTWTDIVRAELPPLFDGLKAAAREVGGLQVQNVATVAGNVCNASPAADGVPALMALDAEVELASARGARRLPLDAFVLGNRRTARRSDELVTTLHVPARSARARSVFLKLGGRRHLVISISMVAATVDVDAAGRVVAVGVAVGSCSAVASRLAALESRLVGADVGRIAALVETSDLDVLAPIDDVRASAAYRRDATATLVRRALDALSDCSPHQSRSDTP